MPKQIYKNGKVAIVYDENNPKDKVKMMKKKHKGKDLKKLTQKEKVELFDLYVEAEVITL